MRGTGLRGRRRLVSAVLALALGAAVVACTPADPEDDDTTTPAPTTSEPTTTDPVTSEPATDAPTPPDLDPPQPSDDITVDDRSGAAAAAEYFLLLTDYARATGDTAALEAMSGSECQYCASMLTTVASPRRGRPVD